MPTGAAPRTRAALLTLALAAVAALSLLWPAALTGGAVRFSDTQSYLRQGARVAEMAVEAFGGTVAAPRAPAPAPGAAPSSGDPAAPEPEREEPTTLRSLPYAVFAHVAWTMLGGGLGVAFAQGFVVALASVVAIAPVAARRPAATAAAAAAVVIASPVAWYAVFLTPDLLGAVVILYGWLLVGRIDRLPSAGAWLLAGVAAFGICAHYGNIALAAAAFGTALLARAAGGALTRRAVALAAAPLAAALALNAAIGLVATEGRSTGVAPLRLPLLLARSIEDGPARWHLERACPDAGYAVCEVFRDGIPDNIWTTMWSEGGLSQLDAETMARVRAEEMVILLRALREHPAAQLRSLGRNAALQLVSVGVDTHNDPVARAFSPLHQASYFIGIAAIVAALASPRRRTAEALGMTAVLVAALLVNAAVFGGLSAPVDRYGGRIAWLAPLLAAILFLSPRPTVARADAPGPRLHGI